MYSGLSRIFSEKSLTGCSSVSQHTRSQSNPSGCELQCSKVCDTLHLPALSTTLTIRGPHSPVKAHVVSGPEDSEIPADSESTHILTVS